MKEYNWKDKIVMVAEDEQTNYLFLKAILQDTGAEMIWVKNGQEAIETVKFYNNIDLILMDIKMPVMNGIDASESIKKMFPTIPIIAQTAYSQAEDERKAMQVGCNAYIAKPIRPDKLLSILSEYLD